MNTQENSKPIKVLVVEDDPEIAFLLKFLFEREKWDATLLEDGHQAFEYIGSHAPPHLILLDIMLPYQDGYQIVAKVRDDQEWKEIPIVMLTAKSQEQDIVRALELGANDYVTKPFQPIELLARIKRLVLKNINEP